MSRVITFDKGSKRRIRRVRWKLREVISIVSLSLLFLGLGTAVALWEIMRSEPTSKSPHMQAAH